MNTHLTHPQHPALGDPERRVWLLATAAVGGVAITRLLIGEDKA
jgi:hypothetical protein